MLLLLTLGLDVEPVALEVVGLDVSLDERLRNQSTLLPPIGVSTAPAFRAVFVFTGEPEARWLTDFMRVILVSIESLPFHSASSASRAFSLCS